MKAYYIMIHFDGPYVNGFIVPQALNEEDAIKKLKYSLVGRKKSIIHRDKDSTSDDFSFKKLNSILRSLKKPWRVTKRSLKLGRPNSLVRIVECNEPILAGYWLKEIKAGESLCNMQ